MWPVWSLTSMLVLAGTPPHAGSVVPQLFLAQFLCQLSGARTQTVGERTAIARKLLFATSALRELGARLVTEVHEPRG